MKDKDLLEFVKNITFKKTYSKYEDEEGNYIEIPTIQLMMAVEYFKATKEEYEKLKFNKVIDKDLKFNIINEKRQVTKDTITGKKEDITTIVDKEVAVREIWFVKNTLGMIKAYNNKEDALKFAKETNEIIKNVIE